MNRVCPIEPGLYAVETPLGKGDLFVRCYLILEGEEALAIDAGMPETADTILGLLEEKGVRRLRLLALTHAHADHIGAAVKLKSTTDCLIAIERTGTLLLQDADLRFRDFVGAFPIQLPPSNEKRENWYRQFSAPVEVDIPFDRENFQFSFGPYQIQAIPAPGHSWDSVCFYIPHQGWLFTGDAAGGDGLSIHLPCYRDVELYRGSLMLLRSLNIQRLLTGHFSEMGKIDAHRFLAQSLDAIDHIHQDIVGIMQSAEQPLDLETISRKIAQLSGKEYSLQALFTTLAHLNQLQSEGLVNKFGIEGALYTVTNYERRLLL